MLLQQKCWIKHMIEKRMEDYNLKEVNSYCWQAWLGVRLAQDCYVFMNGFTQEILILLFTRVMYLNLGWLPSLLQQLFVKAGCLSLVCELLQSEPEGAVWGWWRTARALRSWGRPSSVWERHGYLHLIGVPCWEQMLTWCTAAVSCKLPIYSASAPTSFAQD